MSSEHYRYYHLDGDGHIHDAEWLSAVDDEQAVEQVRARHPDVKCEIWEGARLVTKLVPAAYNPDHRDLQDNVANASKLARQMKARRES